MFFRKMLMSAAVILVVVLAVSIGLGLNNGIATAMRAKDEIIYLPLVAGEKEFTTDFRLEECKFSTEAKNPHFILQPGYQLILEGEDDGEQVRVVITVLNKTKKINLSGIGEITTRVVQERESVDGELVEISRNFFAQCNRTNDIYYFGEEVDIYEDGEIVSHDGAWEAGKNGAVPGIIMPGTFLLGSRYFQERAPGVALDRAEHILMGLSINTPAGNFTRCVEVLETTPLEPGHESVKRYCPGVGLIFDSGIELVDFGPNSEQ